MYSLPSASQIREPAPRLTTKGSPPTPRNARTGELTPPGNSARARSMMSCERSVRLMMASPAEAADRAHDRKRARLRRLRSRRGDDADERRGKVHVVDDLVERDIHERSRRNALGA